MSACPDGGTNPRPTRFVLVDAFRGIAAILVVVYHLWDRNIARELNLELAEPLQTIATHGWLGVPIFFVLSGFVIAHSTFAARITPGYCLRFALRRSIRLDLPYWFTIALAIGTLAISNRIGYSATILPSVGDIAAHLAYLQGFLGIEDIVPVFWTLCFEVQFYLFFILLQGLAQSLSIGARPTTITAVYWLTFGLVFGGSLLVEAGLVYSYDGAFFIRLWFAFFCGVAAYWAYRKFLPLYGLIGVLAGTLIAGAYSDLPNALDREIVTVCIATILFVASRTGQIGTLSGGRILQMLGKISYSLYLTHTLVGSRFVRFVCARYPTMGIRDAVLLLIAGVLASILFAALVYLLVERAAIKLSQRIRLNSEASSPAVP